MPFCSGGGCMVVEDAPRTYIATVALKRRDDDNNNITGVVGIYLVFTDRRYGSEGVRKGFA